MLEASRRVQGARDERKGIGAIADVSRRSDFVGEQGVRLPLCWECRTTNRTKKNIRGML